MTSVSAGAVITAGGRISGEFAERTGVSIKALLPIGDRPLITFILEALRVSGAVGPIAVVGPVDELEPIARDFNAVCISEGETGIENVERGLSALQEQGGGAAALSPDALASGVLVCTSDLPFVEAEAIREFVKACPADAEIVYPIAREASYMAACSGSPNTFARLADGAYTGGGVLRVDPAAFRANRGLIDRVFDARKSQLKMARLLGISSVLRFFTRRLTVSQAEQRASEITGCRCRALRDAPISLCADIDSLQDYEWVLKHLGIS